MALQREDLDCVKRIEAEEKCHEYLMQDTDNGLVKLHCSLEANHPEQCLFDITPNYDPCGQMIIDDTTYGQGRALECTLPKHHKGVCCFDMLDETDQQVWDLLLAEQRKVEEQNKPKGLDAMHYADRDVDRIRDAQAASILRIEDDKRRMAAKKGIIILGRM